MTKHEKIPHTTYINCNEVMKMQTEPTEAERKEISDCLATVAGRFKLYFEKAGISYLSSGYLEKVAAAVGLKTYTVRSSFK